MSKWIQQELKPTAITRRVFGELTVEVQVADTSEGFYHRLVCGDKNTEWSRYYQGIDLLKIGDRMFISGTCYGLLPCGGTPYELKAGRCDE